MIFPTTHAALEVQDSFMLGPDLLVAPVLEEGATDRQVYLPEHAGRLVRLPRWAPLRRAQTITVPAPARPPACLRPVRCHHSGHPADRRDRSERRHAARVIVFGAPQDVAEAFLYEDDGDTSDWQGDGRLELRFQLRRSDKDLVLSVIHRFLPASFRHGFGSSGRHRRADPGRNAGGIH